MRRIKHKTSLRSGMALMLVIPAVALTALLAYAVLANAGTQDEISSNAQSLAQADCVAESGINYGLYSLQQEVANQSIAPIAYTQSDQVGGMQQAFAVSVVVTKVGLTINAAITAIGTISRDTTTIRRTLTTNVRLTLATDFGSGGSSSRTASQHFGGNVSSGQNAFATGSSGSAPITNIRILNWVQ